MKRLLVANRGEIAVRVIAAAADLGIETVAVVSDDDAGAAHAELADRAVALPGSGPAAYLDIDAIVRAATTTGCDALHPGYGFLSESPALAAACQSAGVTFVGPPAEQLRALGDKAAARALAESCDVPVLPGTGAVDRSDAQAFAAAHDGPVMVKAVAGGGGRGMRTVETPDALDAAWERCRSEARRAFGDERLYVEAVMPDARHLEVQMLGDGTGAVAHLGVRDCTIQRRHQKLIEITPCPTLDRATHDRLTDAATRMATRLALSNACTFEFLVAAQAQDPAVAFIEANPRLQVEHTVTEEACGVDLVAAQLRLADGSTLDETLGVREAVSGGYALQARVTAEGLPATAERFELPHGPGVRVDTALRAGDAIPAGFDPLLAKLVVRADDMPSLVARARRVLGQTRIDGVATNLELLRTVLSAPQFGTLKLTTRFVDDQQREAPQAGDGALTVTAPLTGVVIAVSAAAGDAVAAGAELVVIEAMKMEHAVTAPAAGTIERIAVAVGDQVDAGQVLAALQAADPPAAEPQRETPSIHPRDRADLAETLQRKQAIVDEQRPDAVAKRHAAGGRTARENVAALLDAGTVTEYGGLVVAAQRARRTAEELREKTPADGVVTAFGTINGEHFEASVARSLVIAFDETVLAGTMGEMAREKLARTLDVAARDARPVVLLAEGGGGRAGDTDRKVGATGWTLDVSCYHQFGRLSGLVPLVGVVHGRCFAANAGVLACCDVIIATRDAHLGVGGPSMIEGGRMGSYAADEIGPMSVQAPNGVVDVLVADEAEATETAKRYLSYFQGDLADFTAADQDRLRAAVPENRLRAYDVRDVIALLADADSVLELRAAFAPGMVTALARVEGRPLGICANNPLHLGGAIDSDGADKAARFVRLCDAFDVPILMLCDTPGIMVGPASERTGAVRRMGRLFVTGANLTVPTYTIVLRKAYGIGAELMAGGWFRAPRFTIAWPTGELGGMNIEGNVQLAHRGELDAIADPEQRRARFEELVAEMHETGRALEVAALLELDDVIDPAESRAWIAGAMATHRPQRPRTAKQLPYVDPC